MRQDGGDGSAKTTDAFSLRRDAELGCPGTGPLPSTSRLACSGRREEHDNLTRPPSPYHVLQIELSHAPSSSGSSLPTPSRIAPRRCATAGPTLSSYDCATSSLHMYIVVQRCDAMPALHCLGRRDVPRLLCYAT